MLIVPEKEIGGLMTPDAAFDAIQAVFAAMDAGQAYNFPVVREAIGHQDALYGFKGGFGGGLRQRLIGLLGRTGGGDRHQAGGQRRRKKQLQFHARPISEWPVISGGRSRPIRSSTVGATSASRPLSTRAPAGPL